MSLENTDVMSAEKEKETFQKLIKTKDRNIRNELITKNLPLAKMLASNYAPVYKVNIRIIQSYAYEGLCNAVDKFNPELGNRFSTYANSIIVNTIKNGVLEEEKNNTTEVNPSLFRLVKPYIKQIEEKYETSLIENPNIVNEIVTTMLKENIINKDQYDNVKKYILRTIPLSFEGEKIDFINDGDLNKVLNYDLKGQIIELLDILSPIQKEILILRYGLFEKPKTCKEIAEIYGLTKGGVSYHEQRALDKLRKSKKLNKIASYNNEEPLCVDYGYIIEKEEYDEENNKTI